MENLRKYQIIYFTIALTIIALFYFDILGSTISILFLLVSKIWNVITSDRTIKLISVLAWPSVVMISVLFFKKIIANIFFSVDEFNFFGIKGELKSVYTVIEEQSELRYRKKLDDEQREREERERQKKIRKIKDSKDTLVNRYGDLEKVAEDQSNKITELEKIIADERSKREKISQEVVKWMFEHYDIRQRPKTTNDTPGKQEQNSG